MKRRSKSFVCPHCKSHDVAYFGYPQKSTGCRIIITIGKIIFAIIIAFVIINLIESLQLIPIVVEDTIAYQYVIKDNFLEDFPAPLIILGALIYLSVKVIQHSVESQIEVYAICKECGTHWTIDD